MVKKYYFPSGASSFAIKVRFTFIAPTGQNSWQQKHRMHFLRSMRGFLFTMVIAFAGQMEAHFEQPTQLLFTHPGTDVSAFCRKADTSFPRS